MSRSRVEDKVDGNEVDLSLSNLTDVPVDELAKFPTATHLDLSCNLIIFLPDSFCMLIHLVKVDLSKNKLKALPEEFGRLVNLQHLDLLGNQLTTLPPTFHCLCSLRWLDLKDNPLEPALKERAGECLDEKQCRACAQNVLLYMEENGRKMKRRLQLKKMASHDLTLPTTLQLHDPFYNLLSAQSSDQDLIFVQKLVYWVLFLLSSLIVGVTLTMTVVGNTTSRGMKRVGKAYPCLNPVCTKTHDAFVRMFNRIGNIWRSISNTFN